jgi:short-subunit dehydrogenase
MKIRNSNLKTALIIGGSTGIGLDIAKRLGGRGAAVTITGRDTSKLECLRFT